MALTLDTQVKNTILGSLQSVFDGGVLEVWDDEGGGVPSNPDGSTAGHTLLAEVDVPTPAFNAPSGGSMSAANLNWSDPDAINASGTAVYFRLKSSDSTQAIQGSVGVGSGDLQVDTTDFVQDGSFEITGFTISL